MGIFNRVVMVGVATGFGPVMAQAATTIVALSGTAAPAGGNYSSFGSPMLNGGGQVAFFANLTGGASSQGIFAGTPGSLQTVARVGIAAPAGGNYSSFFNIPILNGAGQVAFTANLTGGSSSQGLFAGVPGSLQTAARVGVAAPAGGNYSGFGIFAFNGAGQVAFLSTLTGGTSNRGIFTGAPGSLQVAAREGTAAPAGGNYNNFGSTPVLNGSGQVAFLAILTGGSSSRGIFAGTPGSLQTIALAGTPSPAGGNYGNLGNPALNGAGHVAFSDSGAAIIAGAPGSLQTVALQGDTVPGGAGGNYSSFNAIPVINGAGQVAFSASLTDFPVTQGIFVGAPGLVQVAALKGDDAPGGGNYDTFLSDPVLNAAGQVAFTCNLIGDGITSANDTALFAGSPGNVVRIVREGDVIDVDPSAGVDNRTVSPSIEGAGGIGFLTGSGGQDGKQVSLNDSGQLVYRLAFTDGSSGIFNSAVPEPACAVILGALALAGRMRRTRRADTIVLQHHN